MFYTIKGAYERSENLTWWQRLQRRFKKPKFVLMSEFGEFRSPWNGIFFTGSLYNLKIKFVGGECVKTRAEGLVEGKEYNIKYGDPVLCKNMKYCGYKDFPTIIKFNSLLYDRFHVFSKYDTLGNLSNMYICLGANFEVEEC